MACGLIREDYEWYSINIDFCWGEYVVLFPSPKIRIYQNIKAKFFYYMLGSHLEWNNRTKYILMNLFWFTECDHEHNNMHRSYNICERYWPTSQYHELLLTYRSRSWNIVDHVAWLHKRDQDTVVYICLKVIINGDIIVNKDNFLIFQEEDLGGQC